MYSRRRGTEDSLIGLAVGSVLVLAIVFILSCAGINWMIYDAVIGYECSGEGIECTCAPESLEVPEQDATGDEVAPSDQTE